MNQVMENPSPASYLQNTNWLFRESKGTKWTAEENKRFENALAQFDKDTPDRWHRVAAMIPGKTAGDVWKQYKELEEDVSDIEAGLFPIPGYARNSFTLEWANDSHNINNNNYCHEFDGLRHFYSPGGKRGSSTRPSEQERKKGIPWTEEEHRQFLMGLKKYGKGDWRNISRNYVTTRTPTQVASHAQKYFIRQHTGGKDKRRASIHDITTVNLPLDTNESSSREGNKSPSPSRSSTMQLPHHHYHQPSIIMTGLDNQKLQNRDQVSNSSNMFLAPFCGMSSYGQMFQEQNLLRATIGGTQFGPYSTIYQMQSMQHQ